MARGNSYDKSYSDKYLKRMKIERVGPLLDQMVIDDISPLKMLEMEFDIANPTVRKLRNMNPTVSHNTLTSSAILLVIIFIRKLWRWRTTRSMFRNGSYG